MSGGDLCVENSAHRVLNLDEDNGNHLPKAQMIEIGSLSINERKHENFSPSGDEGHTHPCKDACKVLPQHPSMWPQRPLMIRPTPNSSTKVTGIRRAGIRDYEEFTGYSEGCILPINNGREAEGESLVVDFESTHFVGTLLLRIKQVPPVPGGGNERSQKIGISQRDYFANKKRRFQAVIRGRFKTPLSMSRCVTGQTFDRPAGKLPARWLVQSFIKFITILAPQLDASLDANRPRFLTPLVATAHTVIAEDKESEEGSNVSNGRSSSIHSHNFRSSDRHDNVDMSADLEEPSSLEPSSVLSGLRADSNFSITIPDTSSYSLVARSLERKKVFNTMSAKNISEPRFDTSKVYTFEFYQHLLHFGDELAVDMGRIGGMVPLAQVMDGQPLKMMAAYRSREEKEELESLWSFDIFHESLYSYAKEALQSMQD